MGRIAINTREVRSLGRVLDATAQDLTRSAVRVRTSLAATQLNTGRDPSVNQIAPGVDNLNSQLDRTARAYKRLAELATRSSREFDAADAIGGTSRLLPGLAWLTKGSGRGLTSFWEKMLDGLSKPSEPLFGDLSPADRQLRIDAAETEYGRTGDLDAFDGVDTFRENLSPAQQRSYDEYLESVRSNPDINIRYWDGAQQDALTDEMIYRGIAASTFGDPSSLDSAVDVAEQYELYEHPRWNTGDGADTHGDVRELTNDNGQFDIYVYPESDKTALGQAVGSGDLVVEQEGMKSILASSADNLIIHEYAHVEQGVDDDRSWWERFRGHDVEPIRVSKPLPVDFPDEDLFFERVQSSEFDALLASENLLGSPEQRAQKTANDSREAYPTAVNLFIQKPNELRAADPELYELMVEHMGFDPLA